MRKYSILIIIVAAFVIELLGVAQYYMAKHGTRTELMTKAFRDINESQRVLKVKAEVESAVRNTCTLVEMNLDDPQKLYRISMQLVKNNQNIVGAGVAFRPDYFASSGQPGLFAPYAFDEQPDVRLKKKKTKDPLIQTRLLPFDYTDREWFKKTMANGQSLWTDPYVDQGGTHIIMCTYVMAVRDKSDQIVGTFFADVPMEDVSLISMDMNESISRSGMVTLCLQIFSFLLLGFIIWRAIKASKRYKEEYVDPEKDRLIAEVEKLKKVNRRLTERNMNLAKRLNLNVDQPQTGWYTTVSD